MSTVVPEVSSRARGLIDLTGASMGSAALAWLTLVLVGRTAGESTYSAVAIIWGVYYGVAGIFAGLQHEVTRTLCAERERSVPTFAVSIGRLSAGIGALVGLALCGLSPLWAESLSAGPDMAGALLVGVVGLTGLVVVLGVLAAESDWGAMAKVLVADASLRLCMVVIVTNGTINPSIWMLAVGAPGFVWLPMALRRSMSARIRDALSLRLPVRAYLRRACTGMLATGCASLMIAGFPWLLAITRPDALGPGSAGLLAALVLFRSPVLVAAYALRPPVLRALVDRADSAKPLLLRTGAWSLLATGVGSATAIVLGPASLRLLFGSGFDISHTQAGVLVLSAGLLGMATLGTVACVALDVHRHAAASWMAAVITTVTILPLPIGVTGTIEAAAVLGPLVALTWIAAALFWQLQSSPRENADSRSCRE